MSFGASGVMNVGTDQTLVITTTNPSVINGQLTVLLDGRREGFTSKYNEEVLTNEPCDDGGIVDIRRIPKTVTGTLRMSRQNDYFSAVVAALDQAFYTGLTDTKFTITSYEQTANHTSQAVYQYTGVVFHEYEAGDWTRNAQTKTSANFTAAQRKKIA